MLALTVLSLLAAVIAVWYAHKQTKYAQEQTKYAQQQAKLAGELAQHVDEQEREVHEWQRRHEAVAVKLSRIRPGQLVQVGSHMEGIYGAVFSNNRLREEVETYIVEIVDNRTRFVPRKPTELELRSLALRQTVESVEKALEEIRQARPDLIPYLK